MSAPQSAERGEGSEEPVSVYQPALDRLRARLADHSLDELVRRSGARRREDGRIGLRCVGRDYVIGYPDGIVLDADGAPAEISLAIMLLLYLLESTGRELEDEWISFEQLPGGAGYMGSFRGRVIGPVVRAFGSNPEALVVAGEALDGERLALGDAGVRLPALPRVPIAYILWAGDADFSPSASVVFDASVEGYLDAEAVTALAEVATRRLVDPQFHSQRGVTG
ncbi:MAG TPA: DUF3786 domain-containing protein [Candidatus Sulfomarinibacteraceae bacterium]|nr:DUF3786 domain-containing protein [Candidatus Sulfomarinibacteraceae bacterium]